MHESELIEKSVFELILNDKEFTQYLHRELPERSPILIASNGFLSDDLTLQEYDAVIHPAKESDLYIDLIKFSISADRVEFELNYEVEGVTFTGVAVKKTNSWILQDKDLIES